MLLVMAFLPTSAFSQTPSGDRIFFFLTHSLSLKEDFKDGQLDADNNISTELGEGIKYKGAFGLKGQYFKALPQWRGMAPLVGLGANISAKTKGQDQEDADPSRTASWSAHLLFGGDMRDSFSSPIYKNLLPYIGLGVGNKMRSGITRGYKISDKAGLSYELGLLYRYNRWSFGLSYHVIQGNYEYVAPPGLPFRSYKAKSVLKSTLFHLGFAF